MGTLAEQPPTSTDIAALTAQVALLTEAVSGIPQLCVVVSNLTAAISTPRPKPAVPVSPALLTLVKGA